MTTIWEDIRTEPWGAKETQEYYRQMFNTVDIPRENVKCLLDNDLSMVDNIDMRRLRDIHKQLAQDNNTVD